MPKRRRSGAESYHDRVANIYDSIYDGSIYWEFYRTITWQHIKPFLPKELPARILDVGCGSGYWGLKLAKSGYHVDFLDISQKMLEQVAHHLDKNPPNYKPELIHASIDDLRTLTPESYEMIIGQGDPLSCASSPKKALQGMTRLLKPGGIMVQSVDNRHAGYDHFVQKGEIAELENFIRKGKTEWLTDKTEERFPLTMFTPENLEKMFLACGYEVLSLIGKTVLPIRACEQKKRNLLEDKETFRKLLKLEQAVHSERSALGRAAHLEIITRLAE